MKIYLRNMVFACVMSLSISVHATHENNQHSGAANNQQPVVVLSQAARVSEQAHTDEYWLLGSLLAGMTGLVILVRYLQP
ncbi:hypothetical protein N9235_02585 [Gammaproteobacteria bacterium]|jgi:hypothetical protein|nr:hypothetical protein [Gammaproteobacteria bacterium]